MTQVLLTVRAALTIALRAIGGSLFRVLTGTPRNPLELAAARALIDMGKAYMDILNRVNDVRVQGAN